MRQRFSNLLAAPFVAGAILMLYLTWTKDSDLAPWIIPFVLVTALIYVFSPQINWWWYNRSPAVLPPAMRAMLEDYCLFYQQLSADEQQRFRDRVGLYIMSADWTPMAWPDELLPPDVQLVLATQAVIISFYREDYLFEKFEKIVVYPYPFPSPEHDFVHASELYEPDGCLIFSAQQLMQAFIEPGQLYNIGMHEYAKAFVLIHPNENYPDLSADDIWEKLQALSRMTREHIESVIGIPEPEVLPVAIHHYFLFPESFRLVLPEVAAAFDPVFNTTRYSSYDLKS